MENESCYGGGDIAGAIFGTLFAVVLVAVLLWWLYKKNYILKRKDPQLMPDDPEATAKGDYAFDNPAFKTEGNPAPNSTGNGIGGNGPTNNKTGSPLDPSWTSKQNTIEKRKTVDDSYVNATTPRLVPLRGSDFTGLGVEVYGGLKEGIFVKKVMPQGPAAGLVNAGDRITSITIDFRHIVQEDAMTILSYASPYNVQLEVISGTKPVLPQTQSPKPGHQSLTHPLYRSSSQSDLNTIERNSRKKLFPGDDSSPLKMDNRAASPTSLTGGNKTPLTTVHKENEREPKKHSFKQQMREMIEEKFQTKHAASDVERKNSGASEETGTKKGGHKFGIRVFPPSVNDKLFGSRSPTKVQADNENNSNIEKKESDDKTKEDDRAAPSPPVVKKRTKSEHKLVPDVVGQVAPPEGTPAGGEFQRQNSLTSSGIRRDAAGIPQEMPSFMMQAANAARDNRKSTGTTLGPVEDGKRKAKAPPRPPPNESELDESTVTMDTNLSSIDMTTTAADGGSRMMLNGSLDMPDARTGHPRINFSDNFAEEVLNCTIDSINGIEEFHEAGPSNSSTPKSDRRKSSSLTESELMMRSTSPGVDNESDVEQEQRSRQPAPTPPPRRDGNKIELNANDITVHRSSPSPAPTGDVEDSDEQEDGNRRTASLGDLSKLEPGGNTGGSTSNTLERAQSLEITGDASVVTVVNGSVAGEPTGTTMDGVKKPRKTSIEGALQEGMKDLSDGLSSLQRHRLKGASAWGNLEDAINSGELLPNGDKEDPEDLGLGRVTVAQNGYTEMGPNKLAANQAIIVAEAPKAPRSEASDVGDREEHISLTTIGMNFAQPDVGPDTNIPDDVKVSRYPFGSLERPKSDVLRKLLGQKEELENTPSVFISADGGESTVGTTIRIEGHAGEPVSLTLLNASPAEPLESSSPVVTSGTDGVSSINISAMTLNGGSGLVAPFTLGTDNNIVTISTSLDGSSQPSSIVMIDDEKLDFSLQTLDDFDDPMDAPPPLDFASDATESDQGSPKLTNGISGPPQPPQRSTIAPNRRPDVPLTNGGFVTEITLKAPEPREPQRNGPPVVHAKPPIVTKKPPKPETKPTTPPSRIPVERRMSNEHAGGSLIPRNSEIRFTTAPYESPSGAKTPTRGVDQLRSNFERSNSKTEIPVLIRRTSIPSISLAPASSAATGGSMSNLSTKASPSRIPVFNSNGSARLGQNGGSPPPPTQNGHTNGLHRSNSNSSIISNNNNHHHHNHLVNNKVSVSITSIKNQSKHPSGKF